MAEWLADWLDVLFGLRELSFGDGSLGLSWGWALPGWVWLLLALLALWWSAWSYGNLLGSRWARVGLAVVRWTLLVWLLVLLARPELTREDREVEGDWLIVLLDRSASMGVRDMPTAPGPPEAPEAREAGEVAGMARAVDGSGMGVGDARGDGLVSRDAALLAALAGQRAGLVAGGVGFAGKRVMWLGFDATAYGLGAETAAVGDSGSGDAGAAGFDAVLSALRSRPASGSETALRSAIESAMQRAGGRAISGMLIASDGRSVEAVDREAVDRLRRSAVPVFSVPLGAEALPLDLVVRQVDAPEQAFVEDRVPVGVVIDAVSAEPGAIDGSGVRVRLVDADRGGAVLDETTLEGVGLGGTVRLAGMRASPGEARWRVEVRYEPLNGEGELVTANNERVVPIEFIDRPLRVLYVEGYPRWEYRYLKTLLFREDSIESSVFLVSADRGFVQEGDRPISRLPAVAEEIRDYDVVVLGDLPVLAMTNEQMRLIREHVSREGAGLLWVAGDRNVPGRYAGSPLGDLLPMRSAEEVGALTASGGVSASGLAVRPTAVARRLGVLNLTGEAGGATGSIGAGGSVSLGADRFGWPDDLPGLMWAQDVGSLKPTVEVLAELPLGGSGEDTRSWSSDGRPLLTRMPYGAGQVLYLGTDETWRWRYGRGAERFETFWLQLMRLLGRGRSELDGDLVDLSVSERRVELGEPVMVSLKVRDRSLIDLDLARVSVSVREAGTAGGDGLDGVAGGGLSEATIGRFSLRRVVAGVGEDAAVGGASGVDSVTYEALWRPELSGRLRLSVDESPWEGLGLEAIVEVPPSQRELRHPEADHATLRALSEATGGVTLGLDELDRLGALLPDRSRVNLREVREPLWDTPLAYGLVVLLLAVEWVGRRLVRLA